ncbi:MAG: 2-oxoacid:acceptor oxidoreductase family protein [Bryobacteraceae bacterium]|nr:2-oxoacid:acceptor oxidoreductase family protein [Solibacteraceae bacterium]MCL4840873.1 2-oxoacid:acceptor oxidoreductase family protein [Bryobacteraceae bacterium]MCO5351747.1 2-oxoacid:acceptor oxidoreductase family protein [Bryobacteraceae bacterium]
MLTEIRIAGFGGQGVILSAHILGRAAAIGQGGYATMTQNYGPEARGGAASAALVVSDQPVLYPYLTEPDILVVMSQEAYSRFTPELKEGGVLIVEEDLVRMDSAALGRRVYSIPATRIAEELGKKMVLNVVMVGFLVAITGAVEKEACRAAVGDSVPARYRDLNMNAFDRGYKYGEVLLKTQREPTQLGKVSHVMLESINW